jgi:hypothetical protein
MPDVKLRQFAAIVNVLVPAGNYNLFNIAPYAAMKQDTNVKGGA